MEWLSDLWRTVSSDETLRLLVGFANSSFVSSLLGATGGALAGAYAAHRILERSNTRRELTSEIRSTNAAISLSFSIVNSGLALKKQHVLPLFSAFQSLREDAKRHYEAADPTTVFEFVADLRTLSPPHVPLEELRDEVFHKLSVSGRALNLVVVISQSSQALADALLRRNRIIASFASLGPESRHILPALYFGLPLPDRTTNTEHADTTQACSAYTDDLIYFGQLLCKDLRQHGLETAEQYRQRFRTEPPRIQKVEFEAAANLIPSDEQYADWLSGFQELGAKGA